MKKLILSVFLVLLPLLTSFAQEFQSANWQNFSLKYSVPTGFVPVKSLNPEAIQFTDNQGFMYKISIWRDPDYQDPKEIIHQYVESHSEWKGFNSVEQKSIEKPEYKGVFSFGKGTLQAKNYNGYIFCFQLASSDLLFVVELAYPENDKSQQNNIKSKSILDNFGKM